MVHDRRRQIVPHMSCGDMEYAVTDGT